MKSFKALFLVLLIAFSSFGYWGDDLEADRKYRDGKYRILSNLTIEGATWIGLFLLLPDARDYRKLWFSGGVFDDGVKFAYTDGNSGFFTDKIAHPLMGSTFYGFLEEAGYHPLEALGLTCVHSILWEFKEYPKTRKVEMKDAVWTMVPSALYCIGDIIVNETDNRFLKIVGYTLSSPSHLGKFIYKGTLGLIERRRSQKK